MQFIHRCQQHHQNQFITGVGSDSDEYLDRTQAVKPPDMDFVLFVEDYSQSGRDYGFTVGREIFSFHLVPHKYDIFLPA